MNFHRFIAIDWSGADKPGKSLQVAECFPGSSAPQIVVNQIDPGPNWNRTQILKWLAALVESGQKVLAGFDFAFAYPYCDQKAYFPEHPQSPRTAMSLWQEIDLICLTERDFYAGPFYKAKNAPFAEYLLYQTYPRQCYKERFRITEELCKKIPRATPSSPFKCVGPGSVGIGSVAGMRQLHCVTHNLSKEFYIWPFEPLDDSRSAIVEIFPRLFFCLAQQNPQSWRDLKVVNQVLQNFGSDPLSASIAARNLTEDQVDALISAVALRGLAGDPNIWQPQAMEACARNYEGWIFGL